MSSSVSTPVDTPQPKRRQSGQRRHAAVTPLSTIPPVYFEEDFHLENPRTFDIVSEHSEIVRDPTGTPSGRKSLATNAILQEKLSWYMDTVEVHLINSISTASKSFFSALGSLRELHGEAADSVDRIQKLRKELAKLDKEMAIDGLKVVNLNQRRDNVRQLAHAMMQLQDIVKAVQDCEDLVEKGEVDQALDRLDGAEALMAGREVKPTQPAATTFRALVLREMKSMIRKQLPSSNDDDNVSTVSASTVGGRQMSQQEKSSILARNLRALDAEDWYEMLAKIYTNISEGLRRLSVQVKILLDITSTLPDHTIQSPPRSPEPASIDRVMSPPTGRPRAKSTVQAEMQQALDLSSLLGEGVDLVQGQISKVVKVRSQQNSELPLTDFLRYFSLNKLFADECEAISGRSGAALKTVIDTQIKDFVAHFGNSQKHEIIKVMDSDKWDAKDFGEPENEILARVMEGSTNDAVAWIESTMIWQNGSNDSKGSNGTATNGTAGAAAKVRSAVVDEQKYILPESALAMLRSIESFQHLAAGIPSMSPEVANLLLDSLKLFNSRSSQLILGAGATRSAGLKNITTKHLALSSQALSFIVALVPYVREFFRRHLPSHAVAQVMNEFDKVKRLFQEHQNGIHEKLVDIMSGRASMHVKSMKNIDWEEAAKNKATPVSPYMETLTKETATLQKVLAKHLPEGVVSGIMSPVFASYREQWTNAFRGLNLNSTEAKERVLADAEFFKSRISKIEGAGDLGEHIVNIVQAKEVASAPPPAEAVETSRSEATEGKESDANTNGAKALESQEKEEQKPTQEQN
ncbi:GARP complex component, partial [Aureobasidium melanogenum]